MCEHIRAWNTDRTAQPAITAYPTNTLVAEILHAYVIKKQHTHLAVAY